MANTTNLNLVKLSGSEKLKNYPTNQAGNMDIIDAAFGAGFGVSNAPNVNASINNLADGLAIVANGNTHAAITSGQYVYVRNHGSLSEGLYVATANISANGTLSGSNLTADSSGGLNSVYNTLNSKFVIDKKTLGTAQNVSVGNFEITFDVTKSGYSAVGIVGWSFEDRSVAQAMHHSGIYTINSTTVKMYGSCSSACTISANAFVHVLYSKA